MKTADTIFAIPTYRLRDVAATVEEYDANFWSNGHSVKIVIFDDSSLANHEKYYSKLEKTRTVNDLYYVGPQEKEQFLKFLNRKLRDKKLESLLVRTIFRPSYGGNRNFSLIYTLGAFLVSADDDMRPYALVENSPESLKPEEVSRGRLRRPGENGYIDKSFDILTSFKDVLGKKVSELPGNFESGNLLVDTSMDLETNVTKEFVTENSLLLEDGPVSKNAVVKIAQSFRTGTNDIDALDYVEMYLHDEEQRQKIYTRSMRFTCWKISGRLSLTRIGELIAELPVMITASVCLLFSPPGSASRITSIDCGYSRTALSRLTLTPCRPTSRTTICEVHWRRTFSTKRFVRC
jgi:hypothetical protein